MSISAAVDIMLSANNYSVLDILNVLENAGWRSTYNGYTTFLPVGDGDVFNWQSRKNLSRKELEEIFMQKQQHNETVGIFVKWDDTDIGGSLLFWPKSISCKTFSLNLHAERAVINFKNYEATDFNWYLERLLPPLADAFGVELFSCEHHE